MKSKRVKMSVSIAYCLLAFFLGSSSARLVRGGGVRTNIGHPDDDQAFNNIIKAPFMAFVPVAKCDAVIIHKQFVVAAGNCIVNTICRNPISTVKVGIDDIYGIEKVTIHPKFLASQLTLQNDYDIAVIKLNESLVWSDKVQAVEIASKELVLHEGDILKAIWKTYYDDTFMETDFIYQEPKTCDKIEFVNHREIDVEINDRILCVRDQTNNEYSNTGFLFFKNKLVGLPYEIFSIRQNNTWLYTRASELSNFVAKITENTV